MAVRSRWRPRRATLAGVLDDAVAAVSALAAERQRQRAASSPSRRPSRSTRGGLPSPSAELLRAAVESSATGASVALTTVVVGEKVRIGVRGEQGRRRRPGEPAAALAAPAPRSPVRAGPGPGLRAGRGRAPRRAVPAGAVELRGPVLRRRAARGRRAAPPRRSNHRSRCRPCEVPVVEALSLETPADIPAPSAEILQLRAQANGPAREVHRQRGSVIPMPTRSLRAVEAAAAEAAAETRAAEPAAPGRASTAKAAVLVWPDAAAGLAAALSERGCPGRGVSRIRRSASSTLPPPPCCSSTRWPGRSAAGPSGELRAAADQGLAAAGRRGRPDRGRAGGRRCGARTAVAAQRAARSRARPATPASSSSSRTLRWPPHSAPACSRRGCRRSTPATPRKPCMRAAVGPPELVLLGLDTETDGKPGILDWLVSAKLLLGHAGARLHPRRHAAGLRGPPRARRLPRRHRRPRRVGADRRPSRGPPRPPREPRPRGGR